MKRLSLLLIFMVCFSSAFYCYSGFKYYLGIGNIGLEVAYGAAALVLLIICVICYRKFVFWDSDHSDH